MFEVSGHRDRRLWIDAGPGTAGLYLLTRAEAGQASGWSGPVPGSTRHALLLFRKHLAGARVRDLRRVEGTRTIVLDAGTGLLVVRPHGSAPVATLVVDGKPLTGLGGGPDAWPLPAADPSRGWDRIAAETLAALAREASGRPLHRALAAACPELGPLLAKELDGGPDSLAALRARLRAPRPTLLSLRPLAGCADADLEAADAVALAPMPLRGWPAVEHPGSWREAAARFLLARRRGAAFAARRRAARSVSRREASRLAQLEANLAADLAGLPEADELRRRAEALLAAPRGLPAGTVHADLADPRDPEARLRFALDPRLSGPANADRLFDKARRIARAREQVQERLAATRASLAAARAREAAVSAARTLDELGAPLPAREEAAEPSRGGRSGPRRYLTTRGLTLLVGRGARENHRLTFTVARPEDLWLHARDVPGAHVVLRDDEGRSVADDIREAAEVAAFFSAARDEPRADVHVARRKHVRPAGGGAGRVRVAHSETVRVAPRDPEGRLRRR